MMMMMMMMRWQTAVVFVMALLFSASQALRFDLQSGRIKCIAEDIKKNSMTVGKYSVVNPNEGHPLPESHRITLRVTSAYGKMHHIAERVESGEFAFNAAETGDYMACFTALDHKPETTLDIEFDWKTGVATSNWSNVAKKNQVENMEMELKRLLDTISSIHEEIFYLRERGSND
ncbi:hypothetical protein SAY86_002969 [Trapa natans]|uniref:GOLD domain-containing protein n=1 Tax=Trapa natans TaxID=22666 RepID=A0AAN7LRU7_TRANT|nr:hypothetical protein SAY86_002969 [Trapa natans]